jgi:hypothetical protein
MVFLGYTVLIFLTILTILAVVMLAVTFISMRRGRFYLPWLLQPGLIILEGLAKILWRIGRIDDQEIMAFSIRLHNQLNREKFSNLPMEERMVFLPQCLRSMECPSALTTEGLVCKRCSRCDIGRSIGELEEQGCKVFIVPRLHLRQEAYKEIPSQGHRGSGLPHGGQGRSGDDRPDWLDRHGCGYR